MTSEPYPSPGGLAHARIAAEQVNFPRPLKGSASQHLVVTMLADYWRGSAAWLPSRLIVSLAGSLGLSPSAASTALSRLAGRDVLEQSNAGRTSRYRFTPEAKARLDIGVGQIGGFGSEDRPWDGMWTVVAFTVPESSREMRELLRSRLKWLGFAPLYGAVWVSAWDTADELDDSCRHLGVENYAIFRTPEAGLRGRPLIEAWDLADVRRQYAPFIDTYSQKARALDRQQPSGEEAFRLRTEVIDAWRAFPWEDPGLPPELLPRDFPLFEARRIFVALYNSLADAAAAYVEETAVRLAPDLAGEIQAFRVKA
ncbi:PaaX family transcriptional regulator C-terminal domain-containing protein [Pseudarthrobacter sp. NPDC058119]|uniref:PaaX family transcriptional regulator n=1 Tax=Pseudarthrobacter sp. NPDC058119 TaxID=3346348 RepID=UPI0036DDD70A